MATVVIFGGSGYIGTKLAEHLLNSQMVNIVLADIRPVKISDKRISYIGCDVRNSIDLSLFPAGEVSWIFNLAAVHREPGHEVHEYYQTNLKGAQNVCAFADAVGCNNILFSSSISVYGPTPAPTDELADKMPNTAYGISKLVSEYIHRDWLAARPERRLVIVRPGVVYGPGDPGNILRMVRAIKRGFFLLPVSGTIKKSYGYIYGLLESFDFVMGLPDRFAIYNYVEKETIPLAGMIAAINRAFGYSGKMIRIPISLLLLAARIVHFVSPNLNGIHPDRVKKVARPTHIVPGFLRDRGFNFSYDFESSLYDWLARSPGDFK